MVRLLNDFSLMCKNIGGEELCVCDYRVNIYGCPNSDFYVMMTKTLIPICLLVTVMSASFLVYLTKFKKQPFFLNATNGRGLLRPRPLHSYHLLVFAYMLFAGLHLIMLLNEWYPNFKAAEVGNMMANACSAACAMFYPVSIVYSTPNIQFGGRSNFRNLGGIMNTRFVDIVGILLFLEPIVTLLPLAAITGHYAGIDDIEMADTFFKVLYLAWTGWEFVFLTILAYFWHKLMTTIKDHLSTLKDRDPSGMITNINKEIKKSTKTVTIPVMAIVFGLLIQAIIYIVMSFTYRNQTVYYFVWDLFYYWIEFIAFPILGLFVESFLLYYTIKNYKKSSNNPSAKSSSSSSQAQLNSNSERKTNIDTTIDTIITIPNPTVIHYTSETTETVEIIDNVENTLPSIQET